MNFGLITEGASEHKIIKHLVSRYFKDEMLIINQIQPKIVNDRQETTGGWNEVLKYCEREEINGAKASEAGKKFLADNAKRSGVTTTKSGLQYEILKEGNGPKPAATDTVVVHYHGTTIEGKVFDSSVKRGKPATFPVNQVIPGWTEALQLMPVGSKWKLVIPSELAYGPRGAGADIKPNSVLVFEVELLEIKK